MKAIQILFVFIERVIDEHTEIFNRTSLVIVSYREVPGLCTHC